ncbi:MAG TPA: TadE family protein [Acidimicrobiia bacterium]|nr:TadE family protein [Acidimicrobiia bacterium]
MGLSTKERGSALVEAALILPFLLLLTFGIWTTARAWNVNNTIAHAARETARHGATIDPWDAAASPEAARAVADADMASASIDTRVITDCIELVANGATSTCDPGHTNTTGTDQVLVRLRYPGYRLEFLFFSSTIDLEGTAISRHEAAP